MKTHDLNRRREKPWGDIPQGEFPGDGILIVDKDKGVTSHDIVGAVRRLAGTRKVGHAGTLDPMATGVLCVAVGRATKLLQYITSTVKEYEATIRLGVATSTEDAQGEILASPGAHPISRTILLDTMKKMTGEIQQVPSAVSAIKVGGKRAYQLVREGKEIELAARSVTIHDFVLMGEQRASQHNGVPVVDFDVKVVCSAGTYIRALARDLGAALGTVAHLTALRRTRVGNWHQEDAYTIRTLAHFLEQGKTKQECEGEKSQVAESETRLHGVANQTSENIPDNAVGHVAKTADVNDEESYSETQDYAEMTSSVNKRPKGDKEETSLCEGTADPRNTSLKNTSTSLSRENRSESDVVSQAQEASATLPLVSLAQLCRTLFPSVALSSNEARDLTQGRFIADRPWNVPLSHEVDDQGKQMKPQDFRDSRDGRRLSCTGASLEEKPNDSGEKSALFSEASSVLDQKGRESTEKSEGRCEEKGHNQNVKKGRVAVAWCGPIPVALVSRRQGKLKPDLLLTTARDVSRKSDT